MAYGSKLTQAMPWTPTTAFPHPLVTAKSKSDKPTNNWASFVIADAL